MMSKMPKIRFKRDDGSDYPEWEEKCLSEVGRLLSGGTPSTDRLEYWNGGIQWFTPSEIGKTKYVTNSTRTISDLGLKKSSAKLLPKGTLLITTRATLGEISIACNNCTTNQGFHPLIVNDDVNNEFVYYHQPLIKKYCEKYACGSTFNEISAGKLGEMPIRIPHPEEQTKIATFLSQVDEVIRASEEEVATLQQLKKGMMQKIFSQEVRFKRDDGSDYPDWAYDRIDSFAKCIAGATPSTKKHEYWENGTIPWMSSGEVNNRQIYSTEKKITRLGYSNCSTKLIRPNTVVMALAGQGKTRGTVAITRIELCTNQSLCAIEIDKNVDSNFLYDFLQTQYSNLRQISSGDGTRGGLNLKLIGEYMVPIPHLEEQAKIAAFFTSMDKAITAAQEELEKYKELKKGLLQQMFV